MDTNQSRTRDAIALAFASLFPLFMAYLYFVVLNDPADASNPIVMFAYGAGKFIQFIFPALYVAWFEFHQIRFAWPTWRGIPLAAGFGLIVGVLMFVLYFTVLRDVPALSETAPEMIFHRLKQFRRDTPIGYLQMAIFICLIHSLWEEYYWRWFVYGWMRKHLPVATAIGLSSVGFMAHHVVILGVYFPDNFWTLAMPFSLGVAVGGGMWAWIYERSGSLYAPWLSHALIDAAIMGLGYVMLERYWP